MLGHPGPASSPSVQSSVRFAVEPTPPGWYAAHNVTIVSAYLDHADLADRENRVERFFINLVLMRCSTRTPSSRPRGWPCPGSPRQHDGSAILAGR